MGYSCRQHGGFSICEALLTLTLIGVIAMMTLPGVMYSSSSNSALVKTKAFAAQLQEACVKVKAKNPGVVYETDAFLEATKYATKVTSGSLITDGSIEGSCERFACYRYSDGSVARVRSHLLSPDYLYDPDGTGPLPYVALYLDIDKVSVTTWDSYRLNEWGIPPSGEDPAYVRSWTKL